MKFFLRTSGLIIIILLIYSCKKEDSNTIKDGDGTGYTSIKIGTQIWMAGNLKTTRYSNGDLIGTTTPSSRNIESESSPKYQWAYDGNESNVQTYGRLYTWYAAADSRNVCPVGWHLPTDAEWTTLISFLGGEYVAGDKLKESGLTHWLTPNTGANNSSRFTALPGGFRYQAGAYEDIGNYGHWWSSTDASSGYAWFRTLNYVNSNTGRANHLNKQNGFSIRCIKDN
jgi:uncharacterized protein (TIGR02145 family)